MQYINELEKEYINDHFAYNESAQTLINLYDLVVVKHFSQNTLIKSSVNLIYRKYSTKTFYKCQQCLYLNHLCQ